MRCEVHGLAVGPEGQCVLCKREGNAIASARPPKLDQGKQSGSLTGKLAWTFIFVVAVSVAVVAWMELGTGWQKSTTGLAQNSAVVVDDTPTKSPTQLIDLASRRDAGGEPGHVTARQTIERRATLSSATEQVRRGAEAANQDYDASKETFEIVVPRRSRPDQRWKLLIWISPGPSGKVPNPEWLDVLSKHGMIWAGPNRVGNEREVFHRIGLAIDVAHQVMDAFPIDPEMVFVGGFSGGAKSALRALFHYPDVFRGAFLAAGADYYRQFPARTYGSGRYWPGRFPKPLMLSMAMERHIAMVTGPRDMNYDSVRDVFAVMKEDGYEHAQLFIEPNLGHAVPDADGFDRALSWLDG
jgi:predicted esterase